MRKDFKVALLFALSAIPAGLAMSIALEYVTFLKEHPAISFWSSIIVTLALLVLASVIALKGEQAAEQEGAKKRMIERSRYRGGSGEVV